MWFNKDAFRLPTAGTYATTWERNNLRQPGFWDLHMSLRKSVAVGTHRVELRWDVFNVLNHTDLGMASHESDRRGLRDDHVADREPHDADRAAVRVLRG